MRAEKTEEFLKKSFFFLKKEAWGCLPQVDSAATEIQASSPFEFGRIIRDDQVVSLTDVRIQKVIDLYYLLEEILFRFKISVRVPVRD